MQGQRLNSIFQASGWVRRGATAVLPNHAPHVNALQGRAAFHTQGSSKLRPSFRNVGKVSATGVFRAFSVEIGTAILPERGEHTASPSLIGPQHSFLMDRALRSGVLMFRGAASEMPCQAGDGQVLSGVTMS